VGGEARERGDGDQDAPSESDCCCSPLLSAFRGTCVQQEWGRPVQLIIAISKLEWSNRGKEKRGRATSGRASTEKCFWGVLLLFLECGNIPIKKRTQEYSNLKRMQVRILYVVLQ
jgi:hypothetical protein